VSDGHEPITATGIDPEQVRRDYGQITLVFQGGGALGAYQVGVYEALCAAGIEPDWVIGTSIGAINAALIAGNPLARRLERLTAFWDRVSYSPMTEALLKVPFAGPSLASAMTAAMGLNGFFEPNMRAFASSYSVLGAEDAGYYSTGPLRETLTDLIDFDLLNHGRPRLTVGESIAARAPIS